MNSDGQIVLAPDMQRIPLQGENAIVLGNPTWLRNGASAGEARVFSASPECAG
jgi:hypothetical protein